MPKTKPLGEVRPSPPTHWVGDGFPVSSVFTPQSVGARLSPFILLDYGGPVRFEPSDRPRGVDSHPHRGFETVTIVYQGELEHRDTAGNRGRVGPGDVQWMTAASGVLHEEKHSAAFSRAGGVFEVAQLWVNLPARHKMDAPGYQELRSDQVPVVDLPDRAGSVRLIAGEFNGTAGAARTFTPVVLWDARLNPGASVRLPVADGFTAAVFVRSGSVRVADGRVAAARELAILDRRGEGADLAAPEGAELLVVGGRPIEEPVAAYGPFVMNTPEEIQRAVEDVRSGRFGRL